MKGVLWVETEYNIGRAITKIDELVRKASKYNYDYLGIADLNLKGFYKFYKECLKHNIKPLIGLRFKEVLIFAKNKEGLIDLIQLDYLNKTKKLTNALTKELTKNCYTIMPIFDRYKDITKTQSQYYNFYIGCPNNKKENLNIYKYLEIAKKNNTKAVFINQIQYLNEDDYLPYATNQRIHNQKILQTKEYKLYLEKDLIYQDAEIKANTEELVNSINIDLTDFKANQVKYNKDIDDKEFLTNLAKKGLARRLNNKIPQIYLDRLLKELEVINSMDFASYFLIVYDFILWAKKNNILVGPGRGSAAGSLVAYCLGITNIDPLEHGLIFERFLNKARKTMPDIDTDFPDDKREFVLKYVQGKYGFENVALIETYQTYSKKVILNDLKSIADGKMDEKLYKDILNKIEQDNFDFEVLKAKYSYNKEIYNIYHVMERLEGIPKNTSKHAAGVIINNEKLTDKIPTNIADNDFLITEITDEDLEDLGYLKIDFLGIRNLRIISEILELCHKDNSYLKQIPFNSEKVFKLLSNADTLGIFQLESKGVRQVLRQMGITRFEDIAHTLALYRPGTIKNIDQFIENKKRGSWQDIDPILSDILKETYGVVLYQEQIIEIAKVYAGYTLEEADILRRAISKKDKEVILKEETNFLKHAEKRGREINKTKEIYNLIVRFADYSFNKSHSVSYATVSYYMAYLKCYHFKEFMVSILNNVIGDQKKTAEYITYSIERGINFKGIDVNITEEKYIIKDNLIYIPFTIIKNLAKEQAKEILTKRAEQEFRSFSDFKQRVKIQKPTLEKLIYLGGFKQFNTNMQEMLNMSDSRLELFKDIIAEAYIESKEEIKQEELKKQELEALGFNLIYDEFKDLKRLRYLNKAIKLKDRNKYRRNDSVVCFKDVVKKQNKDYTEGVVFDDSSYSPTFKTKLNYTINEDNYYKITYREVAENEIIIDYILDLKKKR